MNEFVICINNQSNPASLVVGKVYRKLSDTQGNHEGLIRIVDEDQSESDGYLYQSSMFVPIDLPEVVEQALMSTDD